MIKRRSRLCLAVVIALSMAATSCGLAADTGDAIAESFESLGGTDDEAAVDESWDSDGDAVPPTAQAPTAEPTAQVTATAAPTAIPTPTTVPEPTEIVVDGCVVGPTATPDPNRPRYDATLTIDVPNRSVQGEMTVDFTPDQSVDTIVVRLWPNSPRLANTGTNLTVADVTVDGTTASTSLTTPTLLEVTPDSTIEPNQTVTVAMTFDLAVGGQQRGRVSAGPGFLRLGSILPTLPWQPGKGWATDPATALFAEAAMSPSADYRVAVDVNDGYDVLASGEQNADGVWTVTAARDFALSVGQFTTVETTAMASEPVTVSVGMHSTLSEDPQTYLDKIVDSLEMFSGLWGDYPWPSLTVAITPGIGGGIEFPTHIMQGEGTIGRTTSHEVGHMFFYSLVGNNQGRWPWLDEGLASYAEFRYENFNTRVVGIPASALGESGQSMSYFADHRSTYYNSVYLYPGVAIGDLGEPADIDCALRRYVAANAYGIAEPADFFDAFDDVFPNVVDDLAPFGLVPDLD